MKKYSKFTDAEITKAVELMITRDDLKIREVGEALLNAFGYNAEEVRDQIDSGEYLSDDIPLGLMA